MAVDFEIQTRAVDYHVAWKEIGSITDNRRSHLRIETEAMNLQSLKINSGGQTGADRPALDWAIENDAPHGGWCPKGRRSEDGPIDAKYQLRETPSSDYQQRTEWHVRDSDGTVIFSVGKRLSGNSVDTLELAIKHREPCLHLLAVFEDHTATRLKKWMQQNTIRALNVAGP